MLERLTRRLARRHLDRVVRHLINESEKNKDAIGVCTTVLEDSKLAGASLALSGAAGWVIRYRRGQV